MELATNLQMLTAGLAMGSIYALVALGFVLIFNAVGVVNFAQGDSLMVPAFVARLADGLPEDLPFPLTYLVTVLFMGVFGRGLPADRVLSAPPPDLPARDHRHHRRVDLFLKKRGAARLRGGAAAHAPADAAGRPQPGRRLRGSPVHRHRHLHPGPGWPSSTSSSRRRPWAKKMQAQPRRTRRWPAWLGIRVATMIAITFAYSSILGAAGGILVGPIFYVTKEMGGMLGLKAFCSTIIGGFGNVPGAILGGLFLGVIEVFAAFYISSGYRDAFAFIIMILVLLFRPQGFFGEKIAEKA